MSKTSKIGLIVIGAIMLAVSFWVATFFVNMAATGLAQLLSQLPK